jgi:hypothetical protein
MDTELFLLMKQWVESGKAKEISFALWLEENKISI